MIMIKAMSDEGDSRRAFLSNTSAANEAQKNIAAIADLAKNVRGSIIAGSIKNDGLTALPRDFTPGPMDVICARGKQAYNHSGNRRFRISIEMKLEQYKQATSKLEKSLIVSAIVDSVRDASPGGGFVKEEGGRWYEAGDHIAREKVGQSFRDLLHEKYRSSTRAKKMRRKSSMISEDSGTSKEPGTRSSVSSMYSEYSRKSSFASQGMNGNEDANIAVKVDELSKAAYSMNVRASSASDDHGSMAYCRPAHNSTPKKASEVGSEGKLTYDMEPIPLHEAILSSSRGHERAGEGGREEETGLLNRRSSLIVSSEDMAILRGELPTGESLSGTFSERQEDCYEDDVRKDRNGYGGI